MRRVKVTYQGSIDTTLDEMIIKAFKEAGMKWYAQGYGTADIRDIVFDCEPDKGPQNPLKDPELV